MSGESFHTGHASDSERLRPKYGKYECSHERRYKDLCYAILLCCLYEVKRESNSRKYAVKMLLGEFLMHVGKQGEHTLQRILMLLQEPLDSSKHLSNR